MTSYDDTKWWIESLKNAIKCYYNKNELGNMFAPSRSFNDNTIPDIKGLWLKSILEKIDKDLSVDKKKNFLSNCSHVYPQAFYKHIIQRFQINHDLDEALKLRHQMLINIYENEWKNELLTMDFLTLNQIKHNTIYETGVRSGNSIQVIKIPGNPKNYYLAKNDEDKRYYYCHCPWIKDLIRKNIKIPDFFCYCGAGQYKNFWENVTEYNVEIDIVKSVLRHDDFCEFKISIDKIV